MAPVPYEHGVSYLPTLAVAAHAVAVVYMSLLVGIGLYRSWKSLSPSQAIRPRLAKRTRLIPVFAGLSVLGLILAGYSTAQYLTLSYQVWADQRGIEIPDSTFGGSISGDGKDSPQFYIRRWLSDTAIYQDAIEVVAEKARRFWWGQQIDLAMVSWSMLLAIEGRRRGIPFLWAYLSLAHLINLSFAQNLFYLALLLTPVPIPAVEAMVPTRLARVRDALFPPKPYNWCANPLLFLGLLALNYFSVFLLPYAAETSSFKNVMLFSRGMTFTLLAMPTIVPETWGTVHPHPHAAYGTFNTLFRVASVTSFVLHGKSTILGLASNTPDSHYHRHSIRIPFDTAERSTWERTTTAVGRVLGSTADHPVVAAAGRDVIVCALSLGLWAAVRALDSGDILLSAVPFYRNVVKSLADEVADLAKDETTVLKAKQESPAASEAAMEQEVSSTLRKRGRPSKYRAASLAAANETSDATATPKRRGRPRKVKPDPEEVPGDDTYAPEENVVASAGDVLPAEELDWEAAALTWGLTAVGGLGVGSSGVFGGECISR